MLSIFSGYLRIKPAHTIGRAPGVAAQIDPDVFEWLAGQYAIANNGGWEVRNSTFSALS